MSLREEMWRYEQLTGESAEHIPIIKIGAFLDGVDKGIEELEKLKKRINQLSLGKWYVGRLDGKTEEVASMEEINFVFDKRISELKGENNERFW